jgi:hypothetical protein
MPDIKNSVGEGGTNSVHDVALVQAMLTVVKNAKSVAYLRDYDGKYGPHTKTAIMDFQIDQGLIAKPAAASHAAGASGKGSLAVKGGIAPTAGKPAGATAAAGPLEKPGLVDKGSATLAKLVAALPVDLKDMMIIENTNTVYLPGEEADAKASAASINGTADLDVAFRGKVAQLVNLMFSTHKIVLSVTGTGGHRTFQKQFETVTTHAGPGESNHNFGRAVDIGFNEFRWIKAGGTIVTDDWWLNQLTNHEKDKTGKLRAKQLWKARDAIAVKGPPGLFNTILDGDDIHLQSFDDNLPNDLALVDLLNRVGKTKWEAEHKKPRRYSNDLGLGGKLFMVGTAKDIWSLHATVTKAMIAQAKTDALMKAATVKGPAAVKAVVPVKEADIKPADVTAMQKALKDDFVAAETNWQKWQAVSE